MKLHLLLLNLCLVLNITASPDNDKECSEENAEKHDPDKCLGCLELETSKRASKSSAGSAEMEKRCHEMLAAFDEYSSGSREVSKADLQLIDELYSTEETSDLAVGVKAYAFSIMLHVKDIKEWSKELPLLLKGDSQVMINAVVSAIQQTYSKGSEEDKRFLLDLEDLKISLKTASVKDGEKSLMTRINKVLNVMDEYASAAQ